MIRLFFLLVCSSILTSCALEYQVPPPTAGPLDSTIRASTGLSTGKVKFNGPVTFQIGGANNTAAPTVVTKASAPVVLATAPGATAGATTRTGLPTWQLVAGGVVLLLLLLLSLAYKFRAKLLKT